MLSHILDALHMAFAMFWEILWPLILGFTLSGVVQAVVSKSEMSRMLPDDSPRTIAKACALGAASSSCSYAAVALARSIFRKGANFTAAMVFELASTNLVAELGIIMIVLLGWQFALAEFVGAPIMVVILVILFRRFLSRRLLTEAREQAERGVRGRMEGHAEMDMSVTEGSILARIFSAKGFTAISHYFVMDWVSVWLDIAGGLLLTGAIAAWVPKAFWAEFFLSSHPMLAKLWGPGHLSNRHQPACRPACEGRARPDNVRRFLCLCRLLGQAEPEGSACSNRGRGRRLLEHVADTESGFPARSAAANCASCLARAAFSLSTAGFRAWTKESSSGAPKARGVGFRSSGTMSADSCGRWRSSFSSAWD